MSDEAAILVYFGYFLSFLRPCLTRANETKDAEGDLAAGVFIENISTRDASV